MPYEDVRLIASRLGTDDWRIVSHALNRTKSLDRYVKRTGEGENIPADTMAVIRDDVRAIDGAINAIEPAAGIDQPVRE